MRGDLAAREAEAGELGFRVRAGIEMVSGRDGARCWRGEIMAPPCLPVAPVTSMRREG